MLQSNRDFPTRGRPVLWLLALVLLPLISVHADTIRVSVATDGTEGNDHSTTSLYGLSASAQGDFVVYSSFADNLVPGDTNGVSDVFRHNVVTGETIRVNLPDPSTGAAEANAASYHPSISANGRFVAFASLATNLVANDTNGVLDAFVHDIDLGTTIRASYRPDTYGSAYAQEPGVASGVPSVAFNEAENTVYVAFQSGSSLLAPVLYDGVWYADDTGWDDVFYWTHDLTTDTQTIERCSWAWPWLKVLVDPFTGEEIVDPVTGDPILVPHFSNGHSMYPSLTADGRYVVYSSEATNRGETEEPGIWIYDGVLHGNLYHLLVTPDPGSFPSLSMDGRFLAYTQEDKVLVQDVLLSDTETISVAYNGAEADGECSEPVISSDGRYVAYRSAATNIVPGDTNGVDDAFVYDRATKITTRASIREDGTGADGTQGNWDSSGPCVSADGKFVAFTSRATNLIADDTNNKHDVFVHERVELQPGMRPDLLIRNSDDVFFVGNGIYNETGDGQDSSQTIQPDATATYHVRVQNDGTAPDTYLITGKGTGDGATVAYFDAVEEGNDITALIVGPGWETPALAPGDFLTFRFEVAAAPGAPPAAEKTVEVTGYSQSDRTKLDTVRAVTDLGTPAVTPGPDMQIRNDGDTAYQGVNIRNNNGDGQFREQSVDLGGTAIYHFRLVNNGDAVDSFNIAGGGGGDGWGVTYYDAITDGLDITALITGATGWPVANLGPGAYVEFRAEVASLPASAGLSEVQTILVTATSAADAAELDTVRAVTRLPGARNFTNAFGPGTWMVGIPGVPLDARADVVLGSNQAALWNCDTQRYRTFAADPFDLAPGIGCWVRYDAAHDLTFDGYVPTEDTVIDIVRDWNLLANPHTAPLPWMNIAATCGIQTFGWTQNDEGTGYLLLTTLELRNTTKEIQPWQAFWLRAYAAGQADLSTVVPTSTQPSPDAVAWAIRLSASAGRAQDADNFVGLAASAAPILADNPPVMGGGYVDLYVTEDTGARSAVSLRAAGAETAWDVVAETDLPNTAVEIRFPDLSDVPADLSVMLEDLDAGRTVNMRTTRAYTFTSGDTGATRNLRIQVKPRGARTLAITSAAARNTGAGIQVVYTLSVPARVEMIVRNIAGRQVARIAAADREPGTHTTSWNACGRTGARLPAGQYLIAIQCAADDGTQATRIVPAQIR